MEEKDKLDSWLAKYVTGGHEEKIVIERGGPQKTEREKSKTDRSPVFAKKRHKKRKNQNKKIPLAHAPIHRGVLRITPIGGLSEVGKNMMVFEYEDDIIIVDCGLQFPEEDMLGIDYVIPDTSYLQNKISRIKGIFITHGHLDHIGALPYLIPRLGNPPVYATKLTRGLIEKRLDEFKILKSSRLHTIKPDDMIKVGQMSISFFRVNHSIPDAIGIFIKTPQGSVVHTGDFKFDATPADRIPADMDKIIGFGSQNIDLLLSDSTNALVAGKTPSEKDVGESLDKIIGETKGRLIIASFASLIGRMQTIIDSAKKHSRPVFVSGRSMLENMNIAKELGYLKFSEEHVKGIKKYSKNAEKDDAVILTTGSQGESMSALTRIAMGEHPHVKIRKGDTIILSSKPIIGNERAIFTVINNLCRLGARVIDNQIMDVHASGHGRQEDLKMMLEYVRPKYFIPIHGEYYMRQAHADLAASKNITENNIFMPENGTVIQMKDGKLSLTGEQAEAGYVMIDGLGMGHKGAEVLMERQEMANNGVLIVLFKISKKSKKLVDQPVVYSRGFVYSNESKEVIAEVQKASFKFYQTIINKDNKANYNDIKDYIHKNIDRLTRRLLARRPLIIPVLVIV